MGKTKYRNEKFENHGLHHEYVSCYQFSHIRGALTITLAAKLPRAIAITD